MLKKLKFIEKVQWRPTRPSRSTTIKDVLFIRGGWNVKVGSQEIPGVTGKFGLGVQIEAGQRLIEFCQENTMVRQTPYFNNTEEDMWTSPDGQYQNQIDYILSSQRWTSSIVSKNKTGRWLWLTSWTPYWPIQNWIKGGETTRPFRYDLNQIPYDYKVEVTDSEG